RQGRAPVRARLSIQAKTDNAALPFMDMGPNTETDEQGRWSFPSIPDGTYVIKVEPSYAPSEEELEALAKATERNRPDVVVPNSRQPAFVQRQQDVTVSGGDLSNVIIEVNEGGRIKGTVSFEGNEKDRPRGFSIVLIPRDGSGPPTNHFGNVQPNGTFTVERVPPGEFYLIVNQSGEQFYVKSIMAGSTDLMRDPFRIAPGATLDNVRIRIASDMATLQGRVTSASDAKPVRGALLLLVPADPSRWRFAASYLPGVTEADGTFKITAPPGSYLLIVLREDENLRMANEAFVRTRAAGAKAVTLRPDGREAVEVVAPAGAGSP
ncbi:MAG: hypothetical protein LC731_01605, partial [Acidobacteria bacterium]|nr:hypothetical protein [Acidobacteriota bacterium]